MALTAREWLILPEKEQKERVHELSPHECFLLRTSYAYIHYTEEEKANLTEEQRQRIINPPKRDLTPLQKKINSMTIDEQIQYLFYSKERENEYGVDVKPLNKGNWKGIPYEDEGGYKVNGTQDGQYLQYHPDDKHHHNGEYYKLSSGLKGTKRYDMDGNLVE